MDYANILFFRADGQPFGLLYAAYGPFYRLTCLAAVHWTRDETGKVFVTKFNKVLQEVL